MSFWQIFMLIIDILLAAFYVNRIEKNSWKLSWDYVFVVFWLGFFFHDIGILR